MVENPFANKTSKPFVAIKGCRAGYLQIAESREVTSYGELSLELLAASKNWANILQECGAKRVYWITLSEVVQHLHIHLYPRWSDEESKGIDLFQERNNPEQPVWNDQLNKALQDWSNKYNVFV
jgi:diadenosine tetraphosphate (Ap4A) HIT family hydrolase